MPPHYSTLLQPDTRNSNDWESVDARQTAFYVRGFSTFKRKVSETVVPLFQDKEIRELHQKLLMNRPEWAGAFRWGEEKFSPRQAIDAASREPARLQFQKAIETIVMCEAAASVLLRSKSHSSASTNGIQLTSEDEVYGFMRVEPALSFIHEFDRTILGQLQHRNSKALQVLRAITQQKSTDVFYDMADGHTVTEKLASRVRTFIVLEFPDVAIGDVDSRYNKRRIYSKTSNENVDVALKEIKYAVQENKELKRLTPNDIGA